MRNPSTLEKRILKRIARIPWNVLLRDDFQDLGGYDQVGRILRLLVGEGRLIKIGYGLYAKTKVSPLTRQPVPTATLPKLGKEALDRLKVQTLPTKAEQAYREGRSTQVPTGRMIGLKAEFPER